MLLLDEPLGALDLKLRQAMRLELKTLQREVGITFIYVTHDQEEALTMSDRLAVFNHGQVEQVGTPSEVYENPSNSFVAGFVGTSNVMSGRWRSRSSDRLPPSPCAPRRSPSSPASGQAPAGEWLCTGPMAEAVYLGMYTRYRIDVGDGVVEVAAQNTSVSHSEAEQQVGRQVTLTWTKSSCRPLEESPSWWGAG